MDHHVFPSDAIGRGYSHNTLWDGCPISAIRGNPNLGWIVEDDFNTAHVFASATAANGYKTFQDSSATIGPLNTAIGGVLRLSAPATGDTEAEIEAGSGAGGIFAISSTAGATHRFWYEARVKVSQIASESAFIGLAKPGWAANSALADTTGAPVSTGAFIGFSLLAAAPTAVDAIYQKASTTLVTVKAAAHTLVADTYVSLGFHYDGRKLWYYVNGVKPAGVAGVMVSGNSSFPNGTVLVPAFGVKSSTTTISILDVDWFRAVQAYDV